MFTVLRCRMVLVVDYQYARYLPSSVPCFAPLTTSGCGRARPLSDRAGLRRCRRRGDLRQARRWRGGRRHALTGETNKRVNQKTVKNRSNFFSGSAYIVMLRQPKQGSRRSERSKIRSEAPIDVDVASFRCYLSCVLLSLCYRITRLHVHQTTLKSYFFGLSRFTIFPGRGLPLSVVRSTHLFCKKMRGDNVPHGRNVAKRTMHRGVSARDFLVRMAGWLFLLPCYNTEQGRPCETARFLCI